MFIVFGLEVCEWRYNYYSLESWEIFLSLGKNISLNCPNCFNKVKLNYATKQEKKKSQNLSGSSE